MDGPEGEGAGPGDPRRGPEGLNGAQARAAAKGRGLRRLRALGVSGACLEAVGSAASGGSWVAAGTGLVVLLLLAWCAGSRVSRILQCLVGLEADPEGSGASCKDTR